MINFYKYIHIIKIKINWLTTFLSTGSTTQCPIAFIRRYRLLALAAARSMITDVAQTGSHVNEKSRERKVTWTGIHVNKKSREQEITWTGSHVNRKPREQEVDVVIGACSNEVESENEYLKNKYLLLQNFPNLREKQKSIAVDISPQAVCLITHYRLAHNLFLILKNKKPIL